MVTTQYTRDSAVVKSIWHTASLTGLCPVRHDEALAKCSFCFKQIRHVQPFWHTAQKQQTELLTWLNW